MIFKRSIFATWSIVNWQLFALDIPGGRTLNIQRKETRAEKKVQVLWDFNWDQFFINQINAVMTNWFQQKNLVRR